MFFFLKSVLFELFHFLWHFWDLAKFFRWSQNYALASFSWFLWGKWPILRRFHWRIFLLKLLIFELLHFLWDFWDFAKFFRWSVCYELGFQSENALKYAKKGSDHHKLWEILEITYIAFVDELIYQFTVFCVSHGVPINIANYWMFATKVKNPNFLFVQQMVLTFLHGLMLLRKGGEVKQCRADLWCKE